MHNYELLPSFIEDRRSIPDLGMFRLILIKHAMPVLQKDIASPMWLLSDEGHLAARAIADELKGFSLKQIISSHEPKAHATAMEIASVLGLISGVALDLHEHMRTASDWKDSKDAFHDSIKNLFDFPDVLVFGNETANQALLRFKSAVLKVLEQYPNQDIVIVTHGTVISLLVSYWTGLEPFLLWKSLNLPDIVSLTTK